MSEFDPKKLHVTFNEHLNRQESILPRKYTLTHSDRTGDLFLTIAKEFDLKQISGLYTRLMRDEVLAEWQFKEVYSLLIHCYVSGGFVLGPAKWRNKIFIYHMPMVIKALVYGDINFLRKGHELQNAPIYVDFQSTQQALNRTQSWGLISDYLPKDSANN